MKKFITTGAFPEPEWTQVPNKFFDMLPDMEASEALTTLVLIRETYGYHRAECKMSISKLAKAAGISEGSVKTGAEMAEARGTFRRANPDEKTAAEWELVLPSTIDPSTIDGVEGQLLTHQPLTIDPQVRIKESIKKDKENFSKPVMQGIEASIYQGRPTTQDDIIASQKDVWRGREICPGNYIIYGDWWHAKTGLHMYGAKSKQKVDSEWLSAFKTWYEFEITIPALEEAYKANEWRKVSKPSQITNDAKLAQAASVNKVATPERTTSTGYFA